MGLTFFVKALPGERVEASITLPEPTESILCGTVTDSAGEPAAGLTVLLLEDGQRFPLAHGTTDEQGLFCFGPLREDQLYQVCVMQGGQRVRRLEIQL